MKPKSILILMLLLILPLSILAYGNQQSTAPQSRQDGGEKLNAQVAQLQESVKKLEGRVDELSKLQERVKTLEARVDELYRWTLHPLKKG